MVPRFGEKLSAACETRCWDENIARDEGSRAMAVASSL